MKDCLLAHAAVVSSILDHYPGGRSAGIRQFIRLLDDCPETDGDAGSWTVKVSDVQ
jgi:hypothetical protein